MRMEITEYIKHPRRAFAQEENTVFSLSLEGQCSLNDVTVPRSPIAYINRLYSFYIRIVYFWSEQQEILSN